LFSEEMTHVESRSCTLRRFNRCAVQMGHGDDLHEGFESLTVADDADEVMDIFEELNPLGTECQGYMRGKASGYGKEFAAEAPERANFKRLVGTKSKQKRNIGTLGNFDENDGGAAMSGNQAGLSPQQDPACKQDLEKFKRSPLATSMPSSSSCNSTVSSMTGFLTPRRSPKSPYQSSSSSTSFDEVHDALSTRLDLPIFSPSCPSSPKPDVESPRRRRDRVRTFTM